MKTVILVRHSEPERGTGIPNSMIPLSKKGRELAERFFHEYQIFEGCDCIYSSTYARAAETAGLLSKQIIFDERLAERMLGDPESLDEGFWARQYEDLDFKNRGGESLNETARRMGDCVAGMLDPLAEGGTAVAVSHAAAICSYLTKFCTVTVVDAKEKVRCVQFRGETVLRGKIGTPSAFILRFEQDMPVEISYISL